MNEQKQIEAMARLDGDYQNELISAEADNAFAWPDLPDYDTDGEMERMVRGLRQDEDKLFSYMNLLHDVIGSDMIYETDPRILTVTPAQKREAFLKAKGEWK